MTKNDRSFFRFSEIATAQAGRGNERGIFRPPLLAQPLPSIHPSATRRASLGCDIKPLLHSETFPSIARYVCVISADQVPGSKMSDSYIIEVKSRPAGIVVRDKDGFRFFSASADFSRLEGRLFRSARDAEREAIEHASSRSREVPAS